MHKGYIYKITSPSGKSYIGLTGRGDHKERIAEHKSMAKHKERYAIHHAINKYGWENMEHEILEVVVAQTEDELYDKLKKLERYYIDLFDTFNNGYNLTIGGEGIVGDRKSVV